MGLNRPSVTGGGAGTVSGVTAGSALSGGGTSGTVSVALDVSELSDGVVATADKVLLLDSDGSTQVLESVDDLAKKLPALVTEAAVDVSADYLLFLDGGSTGECKKEALTDLATAMASSDLSAASGQLSIADNAVSLAKMAGLARGKIIYGDASGDPAALAVGSANQVLTTDGTDIAWVDASGGGSTDLNGLSAAVVDVAADSIGFIDANDSNASRKESIADFISAVAGSGLASSSGQLTVSASATATAMTPGGTLTAADAAQQIIAQQVFS